ncbi:Tetratricopeptide repeat-containing protein [Candidatus Electrothrix marina]|uniref:Tetratricopeptide repeat-containing protein n=1 Tax=Candidatus Electrothrix marina TaxID=1859130 RepID=A0A444JC91_9BACT|nr:Tetratricopeptide repeat-containing protein [Candidatus Electrothrix marina]
MFAIGKKVFGVFLTLALALLVTSCGGTAGGGDVTVNLHNGKEGKNAPPAPSGGGNNPLQLCLLYANQGDFQNAIRECKRAVQENPNSAEAHTNLGVVYIQVGKNNKALKSIERGASLAPSDPFAQYNLAVIYSLMNQTDLSLEALDRALRNGFNNADALRFDRDLDNVRGEPEFRTILERHKFFIQ